MCFRYEKHTRLSLDTKLYWILRSYSDAKSLIINRQHCLKFNGYFKKYFNTNPQTLYLIKLLFQASSLVETSLLKSRYV